ncbi:endonuclease VII domain-containing protein [Amycolatopsis sp. NPDC004772]
MPSSPVCVDCIKDGVTTVRPTPYGGPRTPLCVTHHRARRKATRERARASRLERVYSISAEAYATLYEAQGGQCALGCGATGKTKALAVDHDHSCCPGSTSCGKCVRGLLCGPCNVLLGRFRDSPDPFRRAIEYLADPPARRVFLLEEN